ncbi:Oidioi.mRNA.OKI2018_I69.PAR.g11042.t1.cds [Oikopleura dioica]|uniref:Oidioi.mRNA.OKI2018_I69.PAR.g11042.t1.cds n=1 Tax=Oikopleura dioica TaxID=34765 RepID=A0ABN7RWZ6_OIKDI|nr:Oidioi.mRNA.OKI2018_I69.PAR.g11042.t1.cds [Oikopleura dioica]
MPRGFGGSAPPRPPPPSGPSPARESSNTFTQEAQKQNNSPSKEKILQQEIERLNKKVSEMESSMMLLRDMNENLTTYNKKVVNRNAELEKQADELSKQLQWLVSGQATPEAPRQSPPGVVHPSSRPTSSPSQPKQKPPRPTQTQTRQMMALWDYKGDQEGDLQFKEGDVINDVKPSSLGSDWLQGKCNGKRGVFPATYVTELVASL